MHQPPRQEIKLNTPLLPALVVALLILQLLIPFRGWRLLLVGIGGAWLLAYLWARSLARHLWLVREMRYGWAQVGDLLEERFTLLNDSMLPALWAEVIDHSTLPGYSTSRVSAVGGRQQNHWQTRGACSRRGLFVLGPTTLRCGDPLGLYTVSQHYPAATTVMVTPPVVPLPGIEVAPGGRSGEGRPRPGAAEQTVNAGGIRDYLPGDSPRWIHWRSTAHRGDLTVRLFDGAPVADWWILLDLYGAAQAGQAQSSTEEHAVILAASLADRGLRLGRSVGLIANGSELCWLPPQRGDGQRLQILRSLALLAPGERSLAEMLERASPALRKRSSLVLVTPDVEAGWITPLLSLLRGGAAPTVLLLDPTSFGGEGDVQRPSALLSEIGVAHYLIRSDLLDRPEARPGQRGAWKWRTLASGRVLPLQQPGDSGWRPLR